MKSGLIHQGRVALQAGEILRLRNPAGRHIGVARGSVWITQESDPRDHAISSGESFRFDRDGLALVTPVGGAAELIFEDGLVPEKVAERGVVAVTRATWLVDTWEFERRARRMRAHAIGDTIASLADAVKGVWGRLTAKLAAAITDWRPARELRSLSGHTLRDIGVRRD